jgi:hypothetical protein
MNASDRASVGQVAVDFDQNRDVGYWPEASLAAMPRFRRYQMNSGLVLDIVNLALVTRMYGPAVRGKRLRRDDGGGLASMYPAFDWSVFAPGHHGYQRACDLISGQASTGPFGSPVLACAGKTEPPSLLILSQTSAGKSYRSGYVIAGS